ncbi:MAG: 30S ribosomal protein S17 [Ndongobacter sp.]|nr:30S ribosomal protein S17 [Ndongobacter sp.]
MERATNRKTVSGIVVSDKMDKTIVVEVSTMVKHPVYKKMLKKSSRIKAHDETNQAHVGDRVLLMETRPLSKEKRFRLVEVLEAAK